MRRSGFNPRRSGIYRKIICGYEKVRPRIGITNSEMNNLVYVNKRGQMCGDLAMDRVSYQRGFIKSKECSSDAGQVPSRKSRRVYRFPKFNQQDIYEMETKFGPVHADEKSALRRLGYKVRSAKGLRIPPLPKFSYKSR